MSKVSFRARPLDFVKSMPIYRDEEIPPDYCDDDKINRAVVQMPTGMEKDEESETHLQKALSAQQFYGTAEKKAIPIPDLDNVDDRYEDLYSDNYLLPKQYIRVEALGMEQEIPDYDLDSEDEVWLEEQTKKMEISSLKFEEMMDRLEKGSGQQVVSLPDAKLLVKEDDDLIMAVYDYWLNKRLRMERPLIYQIKSEKRDGTTNNHPYVAFRRRTEKMQTRKNRKNDEVSFQKMVKMRRDMVKANTLLELMKRREKSKKELLQLGLEIMEKRYQSKDFSGGLLAEAEAEQATMPLFVPPYMLCRQGLAGALVNGGDEEESVSQEEVPPVRKKRQYRRRQKQGQQPVHPHSAAAAAAAAMATLATFPRESGLLRPWLDSSEDDLCSPSLSPAENDDENDPDGPFAFKRRKLCHYHAPLLNHHGDWPWANPKEGGKGGKHHRFSLTAIPSRRGMGFVRRRIGRGGRVILDRGFSPWEEALNRTGLEAGRWDQQADYVTFIREKKIPLYKPHIRPTEDDDDHSEDDSRSSPAPCRLPPPANHTEFIRENCLKRHRPSSSSPSPASHKRQKTCGASQQSLLSSSSNGRHIRNHGNHHVQHRFFSDRPTSGFRLNNAHADFAAKPVIEAPRLNGETGNGKVKKVVVTEKKGGVRSPAIIAVSEHPCVTSVSNVVSSSSSLPSSSSSPSLSSLSSVVTHASSPLIISSPLPSQNFTPASTASSSGRTTVVSAKPTSLLSMPSLLSLSSSSSLQSGRRVGVQPQPVVVKPNGPMITPAAAAAVHRPSLGLVHSRHPRSLLFSSPGTPRGNTECPLPQAGIAKKTRANGGEYVLVACEPAGSRIVEQHGARTAAPGQRFSGRHPASILNLPKPWAPSPVPQRPSTVLRAVVASPPNGVPQSICTPNSLPQSTSIQAGPTPSRSTPTPTPGPLILCASPLKLAVSQTPGGGTKVVAAGSVGSSGMCNNRNASPGAVSILKTSVEESSGTVHVFTKETPPMPIS